MGIKLIAFVSRRPDLSVEEFHQYWRDEHGRLYAETPELGRHLRRYELNHRLDADRARSRHPAEVVGADFDGVAVQWFDSLEEYRALHADPVYRAFADADADAYRTEQTAWVLTGDPEVIVEREGRAEAPVKLICIFRRHPDMDAATFHHHWLHHHGALFRDVPELNRPLLGYHQNHGLEGAASPYDGVTEQWFASLEDFASSLDVPAHRELVEPDVARMLDPASISFILAGPPTVVLEG